MHDQFTAGCSNERIRECLLQELGDRPLANLELVALTMERALQEAPALAAASVTFIDRRKLTARPHSTSCSNCGRFGSDIRRVQRTALLATSSAARMAISGRSAVPLAHQQASRRRHVTGVPDSAHNLHQVVKGRPTTLMKFSRSLIAYRASQSAQLRHLNQVLLRWLIVASMASQLVCF